MKNLTNFRKTVETSMDLHLTKLMLVTLKTLKIGPVLEVLIPCFWLPIYNFCSLQV